MVNFWERKPVNLSAGNYKRETIERDLVILAQCGHAIFDLSDLGAQLVEMQKAKETPLMRTLLVYPVRERRNEPERGRRTVISFRLPHFGYTTFNELKGIVWRFLMRAPTERDLSPRTIHDPMLDREIRRLRVLMLSNPEEARRAQRIATDLLATPRYRDALELWLQGALIAVRNKDHEECQKFLSQAAALCKDDNDRAEVMYYKAIVERIRTPMTPESWEPIKKYLVEADRLKPGDGRVLQLLGLVLWNLKDLEGAVARTRAALKDPDIPDPFVAIQAINNLGYFLSELHALTPDTGEGEHHLEEALALTEYLPDYQHVFERRDPAWLDTRGRVLYLWAASLMRRGHREEANTVLTDIVSLTIRAFVSIA